MWKHISGTVALLAISGCAEVPPPPPSPSPAAIKLQTSYDAFRSAGTSCMHTFFQEDGDFINSMGERAEAIVSNNASAIAVFQSQIDARIAQCKIEKDMCGKGSARIGMTTAEATRTDWCFPDKIDTTETAGHVHEQWIYQNSHDITRGYLYFDNGRLTAIQKTQ